MNSLGKLAKMAFVFGLLTAPGIAHAGSPIPVTECQQILDVSGGDYVLTEDVGPSGCGDIGGPITIAANGIHLNTAGVTVNAIRDGIHINDSVSKIVIDGGGSFIGGGGISIGKAHGVVVEGLTLQGESDLGGSMAGVAINGASGVTLIRCAINGFDTVGMKMTGARAISVTNSNVFGDLGIVGSVNDGRFENNNVVTGAIIGEGIVLTGSRNLVANNSLNQLNPGIALGSDDVGIQLDRGNRAIGNIINNFFSGLKLSGNSNVVARNVINGSRYAFQQSMYGIEMMSGAEHNLIEKNLVAGNLNDLYEGNPSPCVNVWRKNTFGTSGGATACIH